MSIGIIGSPDGPTVIFASLPSNLIEIIVGAALLCAAVFLIVWKSKRRKK